MSMLHQMFDIPDATSADKADRLEILKSEFRKSQQKHDREAKYSLDDRAQAIGEARKQMAKSLSADEYAMVSMALDEQAAMQKDVTAGAYPAVGSPGNLRPYDLEGPAKILVPRFTPILNSTPRNKGVGGAREYRRITGYTNAGVGGVKDQDIFFNSESDTEVFGSLSLRRGKKISYSMDVHTAAYVEASVSDLVTYKAQFANMGFQDSRSLSHMAMLWGHKLGEEKAMLFGRGNSAQGYAGPLGTTTNIVTIAAATASNAQGAGSYTAVVSVRAGVGETAIGTGPTAVACSGTQGLNVTLPALPAGAFGYNVYIGTSGANATFAGFSAVAGVVTFGIPPTTAPANPGATDNTASNGYDGLLTVQTNPSVSGYVGASAGSIATNGDTPWQTAFASLFASVYASPDEVWLDGPSRLALGKWLRTASGTAAGYRLEIPSSGVDGIKVGAAITGLVNQTTGDMVDLRVHPYMPAGCSIIRSTTLNIPDSGVGETSEIISVQEYMAQDWAPIQFSYDASTYWYGTYVHYAPAWSGALTGLTA